MHFANTSSKDLEWQVNIHGVGKYEVGGDWEGGGLLWTYLEANSWFISIDHKYFFDYCV